MRGHCQAGRLEAGTVRECARAARESLGPMLARPRKGTWGTLRSGPGPGSHARAAPGQRQDRAWNCAGLRNRPSHALTHKHARKHTHTHTDKRTRARTKTHAHKHAYEHPRTRRTRAGACAKARRHTNVQEDRRRDALKTLMRNHAKTRTNR